MKNETLEIIKNNRMLPLFEENDMTKQVGCWCVSAKPIPELDSIGAEITVQDDGMYLYKLRKED